MTSDKNQHTFLFLNTAAIIIILAAVKMMEPIIAPLLISIFIAAISAPTMFWFMQHKIPQTLAIAMVFSLVFISSVVIFNVVGSSLSHFIADIPEYQQKLEKISLDLIPYANNLGLNLNPEELNQVFDLSAVMGFVGKTFKGVLNTLTNVFLILLLVVFILIEFASFGKKMRKISVDPKKTMASLHYFSQTLNHYIVLKSLMSLLTAIPICLVLYLLDIDYPLLWGFLVFLLNFIPNIGSIIAAVPVVLLAIVQHNFFTAIMVMALFFAVNNIVGNMIEPKLMGRKLGLSSLIVFVSLVFWGSLLGTVGMFLSVPLTMALKIAMESNEKTRWIAVLLGNDQDEIKAA
ncbi:MAG: AI-2E family transporter [Pseudomonadota bacterium]